MDYKLVITERAEELLDRLLSYLIYRLKNKQAAEHLILQVEKVYDTLEDNPYRYPVGRDPYLKSRKYREALVPEMNYIIIFVVEEQEVTVLGIFHQLEDYTGKI